MKNTYKQIVDEDISIPIIDDDIFEETCQEILEFGILKQIEYVANQNLGKCHDIIVQDDPADEFTDGNRKLVIFQNQEQELVQRTDIIIVGESDHRTLEDVGKLPVLQGCGGKILP